MGGRAGVGMGNCTPVMYVSISSADADSDEKMHSKEGGLSKGVKRGDNESVEGNSPHSPTIPFPLRPKIRLDDLPLLLLLNQELRQQRQMIAREMIVRKARHALQILLVDLAQQTGDLQRVGRVPDIVDDVGEARRVVGEGQFADVTVRRLEAEGVRHTVAREVAVLVRAEVDVCVGESAVRQQVVDAGTGGRVEVAADDERDLRAGGVFEGGTRFGRRFDGGGGVGVLVVVREAEGDFVGACWEAGVSVCEFSELLHQDCDLDKLDVSVRWIPVDVSVDDDAPRPGYSVFEEGHDGNVVSWHDPVEDVVFALHVWPVDGRVCKVDDLLVQQDVFAAFEESRTSVDLFRLLLRHRSSPWLRPEYALVIVVR